MLFSSPDELKEIWKDVSAFYKDPKTTDAYIKEWYEAMKVYNLDEIRDGIKLLKQNSSPGNMPIISRFVAFVDSIRDVRRGKEVERMNRDAKDFWTHPANDWKPLIALLKGELTRGEFLEQMKAKGVNMSGLENFYKKQDLPLNLKPATQDFKKRIPEKYKENATFKDGKEA